MLRLMSVSGVAALTLLIGIGQADDDDVNGPEIADVVLTDAQWQPLPLGIRSALADPSGRVWLQDGRGYAKWDVQQLQAHIAEQFDRQVPQIRNAHIALSEPEGRVWFVSYQLHMVLGYDGENWITHSTVDTTNRVYARCQTRGALIHADAHRYAGDAAWLLGLRGVYRFQNDEWSYQVMTGERVPYGKHVRLSVEPQGKLAVAWTLGNQDVWLLHRGKWAIHNVPVHTKLSSLTQLVAESSRSFLYIDTERLVQRAVLQDNGRLEFEKPTGADSVLFGKVRASRVKNLYADETGRVYVLAEMIDGVDADDVNSGGGDGYAGGLITAGPNGDVRVLQNDRKLMNAFGRTAGLVPRAILTPGSEAFWLPNSYGRGKPLLLDPVTQKRLGQIPHPGFRVLHAVDRYGRVYTSSSATASETHPLMVWSPHGRTNPSLHVVSHEIGPGPVTVSGDGTVWATNPEGRLICHTNNGWHTLPGSPFPDKTRGRATAIESMIPGLDGMVLVQNGDRAALCQPGKLIDSGDLFRVIEDQRDWLQYAFGPDKPRPEEKLALQIVVGGDGRIWCLHNRALRLLDGDLWYDATDALIAAGSRRGVTSILAPIGDGERVFVSDLSLRHDGGRSFFGQFEEGELHFAKAPHVLSRMSGFAGYSLRDRDGALWIASTQGRAGNMSDVISGQESIRVIGPKQDVSLVNSGHAHLQDRAGNIWFGRIRGQPIDQVNLWRDGRINQKLRVPAYAGELLFSDCPGSVYAYTKTGLQHLVAADHQCSTYRTGTQYDLSWLDTSPHFQAYSCQGFAVFATRGPNVAHVHFVCLPR